jgi:hypothetical protein
MSRVSIALHPACAGCGRLTRLAGALDLFKRVEFAEEPEPFSTSPGTAETSTLPRDRELLRLARALPLLWPVAVCSRLPLTGGPALGLLRTMLGQHQRAGRVGAPDLELTPIPRDRLPATAPADTELAQPT